MINVIYIGNKPWEVHHTNAIFQLHREDGPAAECCNGRKYYYLNGYPLKENQYDSCKDFMKYWGLTLCPGMFVTTRFSEKRVKILSTQISGIRVLDLATRQEDFLHPFLHLKESEIEKYKCLKV